MNIKYNKDMIQEAVNKSKSVSNVLKELGIRLTGGSHSHIKRKIISYGIDTSHFTGQAWCRGTQSPQRKHWQQILIVSTTGRRESASILRRALTQYGRKYECARCENKGVWLDKPMTLEVNHKNNDWLDHRPDNLEFLCPNCHSQYKK